MRYQPGTDDPEEPLRAEQPDTMTPELRDQLSELSDTFSQWHDRVKADQPDKITREDLVEAKRRMEEELRPDLRVFAQKLKDMRVDDLTGGRLIRDDVAEELIAEQRRPLTFYWGHKSEPVKLSRRLKLRFAWDRFRWRIHDAMFPDCLND